MQKCISLLLLFVCIYLLSIPFSVSLYETLDTYFPKDFQDASQPELAFQLTSSKQPVSSSLEESKLYAHSACLMDSSSNRVLFSKNADEKLPMASTTKIMTCIILLENATLSDTVTFSKYAASMPDVQLNAKAGEQFRLEDLLYSLMLESHNDTAVALAEHLGGSVEGFAKIMNEKALALGLTSTNFVTPNGLDAKEHYTTAKDLCTLSSYAIKNPKFLEIIGRANYSFSNLTGSTRYSLSNKDGFLTSYKGATGIKTGFTSKAGYCFCGAAKRNDTTLVSAVLASGWPPNKSYKWADTKALMNYGFDNFVKTTLSIQPPAFTAIPVKNGQVPYIYPEIATKPEDITLLLTNTDSITSKLSVSKTLTAPVRKGDIIGTASLYLNDSLYSEYPVTAKESSPAHTFKSIFKILGNLFLFS